MTTLGKTLGGGTALSAFVGSREVMSAVVAARAGRPQRHVQRPPGADPGRPRVPRRGDRSGVLPAAARRSRPAFYPELAGDLRAGRAAGPCAQANGARFSLLFGLERDRRALPRHPRPRHRDRDPLLRPGARGGRLLPRRVAPRLQLAAHRGRPRRGARAASSGRRGSWPRACRRAPAGDRFGGERPTATARPGRRLQARAQQLRARARRRSRTSRRSRLLRRGRRHLRRAAEQAPRARRRSARSPSARASSSSRPSTSTRCSPAARSSTPSTSAPET